MCTCSYDFFNILTTDQQHGVFPYKFTEKIYKLGTLQICYKVGAKSKRANRDSS